MSWTRRWNELVPALGPLEGEPAAADGGITNRNYRVRLGGGDYVLRLCGKDTAVLGIDRDDEAAATERPPRLGVGPAVVHCLPGALVTRFIEGRPVSAEEVRGAPRRRRAPPCAPCTTGLRAGPLRQLPRGRAPTRAAEERGGTVPADYDDAAADAARIERVLGGRPPVPCHNDLLTANFIDDGERLRIVDWEYAGMGERFFDLGEPLDQQRVLRGRGPSPAGRLLPRARATARFAALRLMRVMSDFREAMWGVVQTVASDIDFDYAAYAAEHFARLRGSASTPGFDELERAAAA